MQATLRLLPKIDQLLARDDVTSIDAPRWAVVEAARRQVETLRRAILAGESERVEVEASDLAREACLLARPSVRRVVNATGVVLHTNLGRAPLAPEAIARMTELAGGYTNLEYDIDAGRRGSRHGHITELLRDLTGAEDAALVNNNAGAVLLVLAALAEDREVIVSRGELIEIGGSFRIPDVMRMSGAHLVEVGTTNKTRVADYDAAISDRTALLLKVHQSNFAIVGFTEEAQLTELAELGTRRGVRTAFDVGSGALLSAAQMTAIGLPGEPSVRELIETGVDLVTFSGDKLLGGPQAGIIVGRAEAVAAVRTHPLMRALRPDKLTIAALEATLSIYRDGRAHHDLPAVRMLSADLGALRVRAESFLARVEPALASFEVALVSCDSKVGGGALPLASLPSWGVSISASSGGPGPDAIDARLRRAEPPVVARILDDTIVLDMRTLDREDDRDAAVAAVLALV